MRNNKGITLVALIITIIILIILAGISINLVLGENGLFGRALQAREDYKKAEKDEQTAFNALLAEIDKIGQEGSSETTPEEPEEQEKEPTTTAEAVKQPQQTFDKNIPLQDEYGNSVVIPAGFHIVPNGTDEVEYKYSANTGIPTVQDGIVIADEEGNQFVWIPVGNIKNRDGEETTSIQLQRCTFNASTGIPENITTEGTEIETYFIEETQQEHEKSGKGNTIAANIEAFKTSATNNGGYYLARYEASYKDGIKPYSKPSTSFEDSFTPPTTLGQLWNNITQPNAAIAAKAMYDENSNFTSDLVNSYAWDTAIVFLQTYSSENGKYSRQTSRNSSLGNTGKREDGTTDKVCNIYDMASNCEEWTTETSTITDTPYAGPSTRRGGIYKYSDWYTSFRLYDYAAVANMYYTFRPVLYIGSAVESFKLTV